MSYEHIKSLSPTHFKRYCDVKPHTFNRMCEFVRREPGRNTEEAGQSVQTLH